MNEKMNLMDVLTILAGAMEKKDETSKEAPETGTKTIDVNQLIEEQAEMDFQSIQKSKLTYDEAVACFEKNIRFVCKMILGEMIDEETEEAMVDDFANTLQEKLIKAKEDSKPEGMPEGDAKVDLDFYINQCAAKSLRFMMNHGGKLSAAMASGYTAALVDAGILENTKEAKEDFSSAVIKRTKLLAIK